MNYFRALALLPLLIKLAEVVYGAKKGQVKKDAVIAVFFGVLRFVDSSWDTPELRQIVSDFIDELVAFLNDTHILPK